MGPVVVNVPAEGSYSSALANIEVLFSPPPAIRTRPFGNKVAVWNALEEVIGPVAVKVPLDGLNSSASEV
jgi:hypothetical protein